MVLTTVALVRSWASWIVSTFEPVSPPHKKIKKQEQKIKKQERTLWGRRSAAAQAYDFKRDGCEFKSHSAELNI